MFNIIFDFIRFYILLISSHVHDMINIVEMKRSEEVVTKADVAYKKSMEWVMDIFQRYSFKVSNVQFKLTSNPKTFTLV